MAEYFTNNLPVQAPVTGLETMPADSNAAAGSSQQVAVSTAGMAAYTRNLAGMGIFPKNVIDGGDFSTNPWQRGTTFTAIAATNTYTADRWFAYGGASSSISVSKSANTTVLGMTFAMLFGRGSGNANTAVINLAQIVETIDTYRLQGQPITLSFYAATGANYSGGALSVSMVTGTGTNEGNASLVAATWTGQATMALTNNQSGVTGLGAATQVLTSTMTRYSFSGTVPTTAAEIAVILSYTPTGTAGANDNIIFLGFQLEVGTAPTVLEHLDEFAVLEQCQRYFVQINEPGTANVPVALGMTSNTNVETFVIPLPQQMRIAPTVTPTAGNFKCTTGAGTYTAVATLAGAASTPNAAILTAANTNTFGNACMLVAGATSAGNIAISADL